MLALRLLGPLRFGGGGAWIAQNCAYSEGGGGGRPQQESGGSGLPPARPVWLGGAGTPLTHAWSCSTGVCYRCELLGERRLVTNSLRRSDPVAGCLACAAQGGNSTPSMLQVCTQERAVVESSWSVLYRREKTKHIRRHRVTGFKRAVPSAAASAPRLTRPQGGTPCRPSIQPSIQVGPRLEQVRDAGHVHSHGAVLIIGGVELCHHFLGLEGDSHKAIGEGASHRVGVCGVVVGRHAVVVAKALGVAPGAAACGPGRGRREA